MRKIGKICLFIALLLININGLKADCTSDKEEINNLYFFERNIITDEYTAYNLETFTDNENIYLVVTDSIDNVTETVTFENNKLSYTKLYDNQALNVKVEVYSNTCGEEKVKELTYNVKAINKYYTNSVCDKYFGVSKLCDKFADTSNMTEEEFVNQVNKDIKNYEFKVSVNNIISKYALYIFVPGLLIATGFVIAIVIIKKRRKNNFKNGR